jgi:hypothetical protein
MELQRTVIEEIDGYFYSYTVSGYPGSTNPHAFIKPRERDYWYSHERHVGIGQVRLINQKEYYAGTVTPRWLGLLPPRVCWFPR